MIILSLSVGKSKYKNIDHRGKETQACENDHIFFLCDSTISIYFVVIQKKKFIWQISIIIIMICRKLDSVGPVQQKIKFSLITKN